MLSSDRIKERLRLSAREWIKIGSSARRKIAFDARAQLKFFIAPRAFYNLLSIGIKPSRLEKAFLSILITGGTNAVGWFSARRRTLQLISQSSPSVVTQIVTRPFCFPIFKFSEFFFKIAQTINQRKLCLLGRENFPLEIYDRPIAGNGFMDTGTDCGQVSWLICGGTRLISIPQPLPSGGRSEARQLRTRSVGMNCGRYASWRGSKNRSRRLCSPANVVRHSPQRALLG
jgi:hypothetical protein